MTSNLPDVPPTCAHCEKPQRGYGAVNGIPLCHPDTGLDCYSLVTLAGHDMPCDTLDADRRYCDAVDDFMAQFDEPAADHHARLAAGIEATRSDPLCVWPNGVCTCGEPEGHRPAAGTHWVCTCGYHNNGGICTHCGRPADSLAAGTEQ